MNSLTKYSTQKQFVILIATIASPLFFYAANSVNVYRYAVVGAIFELLWLPMILMPLFTTLIALIFWKIEKYRLNAVYPYCIISSIGLVIWTIWQFAH